MEKITIKEIGPNKLLEIPLAEGGGITVLRGRNDIGKSEGLRVVNVINGGKDTLSVRDDAPPGTKGKATYRGITVNVFKSTRRFGTAEFAIGGDEFSIEDIVDPGLKDQEAADARRIKALLRVSQAAVAPNEFIDVCGREVWDTCIGEPVDSHAFDPIVASNKLRQWMQKLARDHETSAEAKVNQARGMLASCKGLDMDAESNPATLQRLLEGAVKEQATLTAESVSAVKAEEARRKAIANLEAAKSEYTGLSLKDAETMRAATTEAVCIAQAKAEEIRKQLEVAEAHVRHEKESQARASAAFDAAYHHDSLVSRLSLIIEGDACAGPSSDEIAAADELVDEARVALENGAKIRDAKKTIKAAEDLLEDSDTDSNGAQIWRGRCDKLGGILSSSVSSLGYGLDVHGGRLIIARNGDKPKLFSELSTGARRKVALDILIDSTPETGLIPLPQEAWESLDPVAREEIRHHLITRGAHMVTAACSADDEVVAEVYTSEDLRLV